MVFFTNKEKHLITSAIAEAERCTSGEIRVHVESKCKGDILQRARAVFVRLGMDRTKAANGMLIYIAMKDKKFAILGDEGINKVVPAGFWEKTRDAMAEKFQLGMICEGVILGIKEIGLLLKKYFPYEAGDVNELKDEISEGS